MTDKHNAASEEILDLLEKELPAFFTRDVLVEKSHGIFTKQTLEYFSRLPNGTKTHYMGRKSVYIKDEFMSWLRNYYGGMYVKCKGRYRTICKGEDSQKEAGESGE